MKSSLHYPPEKIKTVQRYWKRLLLNLTDLDLMIYNNLTVSERIELDRQRMTLRGVIARCSRLKLSVNRNIIFS